MDRARLIKAELLFHDLAGLADDSRAAKLDQRCAGDRELRCLVEHLLASDDSGMGGFLETPVVFPTDDDGPKTAPKSPHSIGEYEIVRRIGEGGMGVVYEALQANPRRTVALKVLRSALPSGEMLSRFRHEAHILAQLRHPGIAHIYEAAVAQVSLADGIQAAQPYFAMELVEGQPLRAFAESRKLDIGQRLELMCLVCEAVQHAHEKGVIHRDLKSDNILVEASGRPRILDFGVARLVAGHDETRTLHTRSGAIVGTLAYMSPEQVSGDSTQVDTRSDVYSLGVILYDLLTGRLPHDVSGLALTEAARRICDEEPPPPSAHNARLRGEIDWIALKCLEKDRSRRYHSAIALTEDIQRHLRDEPVLAAAPSRLYRLRKLVRRNRGVFAAAVVIFAILVVAVIGTGYGLLQAREQRDRAESARIAETEARELADRERAEAERQVRISAAVTRFVSVDLLGGDNPAAAPADRDERISDVLARAEKRVDSGALKDEPHVEASVRNVISVIHLQLGRIEDAERNAHRALELKRSEPGDTDVELIMALSSLADAQFAAGRLKESLENYQQAYELDQRTPVKYEYVTAKLCNGYGRLLGVIGRLDDAEAVFHQALSNLDAMDAPTNEIVRFRGALLTNMGELARIRKDFDGAISYLDQALEVFRSVLGEEHPSIATVLNDKAVAYKLSGNLAVAEPLYRQALDMRCRLLPENHFDIATTLNNLAQLLRDRGDFADAEPLYRETLDIALVALPPGHFNIALLRRNFGNCLMKLERFDEAEREIQSAYDQLAATSGLPPEHVRVTIEALLKLYDSWAKADPAAGAEGKALVWRARLKAVQAATQPASDPTATTQPM